MVDEERLRKANDENRELAMTLNRQVKDAQKVNKPDKSKKKGLPSDFGSARGSEERSGTAQATGRGQKRGRNMEIDEVGNFILPAAKKLHPSEILPGPVADPLETKTGTAIPTDEDPEDNAHRRPQTVHSLIGTRLYSPTESLAPYLESDWTNVRSIDDIPNIRYRPKIPATTVKKPSKKRPAPLDFDEEDAPLNESLANFEKRRDRHDAKLDKRIKAVCDYIQGDVQEHPDFPHPVNRQNYPVDEKGRPLPYKAPVNPHPRPPSGRIRKKTAKARALKSKKKTNNDTPKQEESFHTRPMIKIPVPDYIKSLLVDDWEEVTKNLSLVPLPAPKPVNQIIDEYYAEEKEKRFEGSADMDFLDEVRQGLKEYFEVSLGRMLLYRFERQQFLEAKAKWAKGDAKGWEGKEGAGDVYGAEHLCRMIGLWFPLPSLFPFLLPLSPYPFSPNPLIPSSLIPLRLFSCHQPTKMPWLTTIRGTKSLSPK